MKINYDISDNLLSAFLEGNTSAEETMRVIEAARHDSVLRETIRASYALDSEEYFDVEKILPMRALAAREKANLCAVKCELHILKLYGVEKTLHDWKRQAELQGWLKDGGTPIHNIGRLLEQECFSISRTYHNSIDDLKRALEDSKVIAVVDDKELTTDVLKLNREKLEDDFIGANPNHAVVVTRIDGDTVFFYDPDSESERGISTELFKDAWQDSSCYMVKVSKRDFSHYIPHPLDLSDVELPDDLLELREAIAENAHEVWAQGRKEQGWTYGPERNDALKQTPDMVPYSDLSDEEKFFDREMAMNTIRLLKKLGYRLTKED